MPGNVVKRSARRPKRSIVNKAGAAALRGRDGERSADVELLRKMSTSSYKVACYSHPVESAEAERGAQSVDLAEASLAEDGRRVVGDYIDAAELFCRGNSESAGVLEEKAGSDLRMNMRIPEAKGRRGSRGGRERWRGWEGTSVVKRIDQAWTLTLTRSHGGATVASDGEELHDGGATGRDAGLLLK